MITLAQMTLLPESERIGNHATRLENAVDTLLNQTIADKGTIFAFGSAYADNGHVDGIHDIHMNQGNPAGSFSKDNGIWAGWRYFYLSACNRELDCHLHRLPDRVMEHRQLWQSAQQWIEVPNQRELFGHPGIATRRKVYEGHRGGQVNLRHRKDRLKIIVLL